jgi:hypothetical protein
MTFKNARVWLWRHLVRVPVRRLPDHVESRDRKRTAQIQSVGAWRTRKSRSALTTRFAIMHRWGNRGSVGRGFRLLVAQAGLRAQGREGRLEIEPPMAQSRRREICLAVSGHIKWRTCSATFASIRCCPLLRWDQSPLERRAGPAVFFEKETRYDGAFEKRRR